MPVESLYVGKLVGLGWSASCPGYRVARPPPGRLPPPVFFWDLDCLSQFAIAVLVGYFSNRYAANMFGRMTG